MLARVLGFDWQAYTERIMPAFTYWLTHKDEERLYHLYEQTRCAHEEQFTPAPLQHLRTWPRAQTFVRQLPQGSYTRDEYQLLCDAPAFTELSDLYVHRHPPRLQQSSAAIRAVWGALIETHCQACFDEASMASGVVLGHHPATLQLRGWLATVSVRAMVLFEFLACGRREMPFGYRPGEPYEDYIGYLTPEEVLHLAHCLDTVDAPAISLAETHSRHPAQNEQSTYFSTIQGEKSTGLRLIDELPPAHADEFLQVVRLAAQCKRGLLCRIE